MTIRPRQPNWEDALTEVVQMHMDRPSEYGVSDCFLIMNDAVRACLGQDMLELAKQKPLPAYSTEQAAAKLLRKRGFENVRDAAASLFRPLASSVLAQRGDIGVIEFDGQLAGGVFTSIGFFSRFDRRYNFFAAADVKEAFKV